MSRLAGTGGAVRGLRLRVSAGLGPDFPSSLRMQLCGQPTVAAMGWTWRYETRDGTVLERADLPSTAFPSQADAESWVGEAWRDLLAAGVDQVVLLEDDTVVYGPMGLHPAP